MSDIARDQYMNYRWAYDNGHQQWLATAKRCFDFWNNKQWDDVTKARLAREGRPALTFNVVESLVRTAMGMQRATRNDVRFSPTHDATIETAAVHDALWLHAENTNGLDYLETEVYLKGLIMGRAYYDKRMSYDDSTQGTVKIRSPRSQDIILDPSIETYDTDEWPQVFSRRWVSYDDIFNLWGKDAAESVGFNSIPTWHDYEDQFMAQQMGNMPYYFSAGLMDTGHIRAHLLLDRQYTVLKMKDVFVDMQTGDTSTIPDGWDRNRISRVIELTPGISTMRRKVKVVKWAVTCENETLHNSESPYNNFTIVPYFPMFVDGVTQGIVESILDPQQMYNKVTSSELHIISTTANGGYKLKKGSMQNMTIEELETSGSRTGLVVELDDVNDLEKFQPNPVPQGHDRLSFKADAIMRSLFGVSNQGRGFAREDVAGEAIESNQAAQDVNFAGPLMNLHRSKQMLAKHTDDLFRTHYTEARVVLINRGTALVPDMQSVAINQTSPEGQLINDVTRGKYTTVMVPSPTRTTMAEADFRTVMELRKEVGIQIPDTMMIELSPVSMKAQIIKSLQPKPDSSEQDAAERQREDEAHQTEQALNAAKVQQVQATAQLSMMRAKKADVESQKDPDAAYLEIEHERIAASRRGTDDKHAIERERLTDDREFRKKQIALGLATLDIKRDQEREKVKQDGHIAAANLLADHANKGMDRTHQRDMHQEKLGSHEGLEQKKLTTHENIEQKKLAVAKSKPEKKKSQPKG